MPQRCPECWSAVDADDRRCAQCGAALRAVRRPRRLGAALAIVLVAGAGAALAWRAWSGPDAAPERAGGSPSAPPTAPGDPLAPDPDAAPAAAKLHHRALRRTADGRTVHALAVASASHERGLLFLPVASLPLEGGFEHFGAPLELEVLHADPARGWALLIGPPPPPSIEPVALAPAARLAPGTALVPWTGRGERLEPATLEARPGERLRLDRELPSACALLDAGGAAVGLTLGGRLALPVDGALLWLDQRIGRPLAEVQRELRQSDPAWLLDELDAALAASAPGEAELERAVELGRRCAAIARDRDAIEAAQDRLRIALGRLVRVRSHRDAAAAISTARETLAEFPDHHAVEADLALLLAGFGDPIEAAGVYRHLAAAAPERAGGIADQLADALRARAREHAAAGRHREAALVLGRAVETFPRRAALRAAYAEALVATDPQAALAQVREAAALDPAYAGEAAELARRLAGSEVVIPFDPETHAIDAAVSVGGREVAFVVDTGASLTTVPGWVARDLGLLSPSNRRVTVQTASGQVTGEVVRLPWLQIGGIRLDGVEAVVIDLPGTLAGRGLLGMSALRRLDVQIDGERGRLILQQR